LQLLIFNEEFLVRPCHQRGLITSLPFVHTARRSYRLNDPVRSLDRGNAAGSLAAMPWEAAQTLSFRGRRSRNKVSVGEPAEGSLPVFPPPLCAHGRAEGMARSCRPRPVPLPVRLVSRSARACRSGRSAAGASALFAACRALGRSRSRRARRCGSRRTSRASVPSPPTLPPPSARRLGVCGGRTRASSRASGLLLKYTHNSCRWISWLPQR
jgi:hypothetical protein